MKNKWIVVLSGSFLISCASVHPGNKAKSLSPQAPLPIVVSADMVESGEEKAFQLLDITIENKSDTWFRVKSSKVVIENPVESRLSVVVGADLKEWGKAKTLKNKMDAHNTQMAMGGVALAGTAVALAGLKDGNADLVKAGSTAILASEVWAVSEVVSQSLRNAEGAEAVPENHLYHPFSVPGKMFVRKWVLLNKPSDQVLKKLVLEIESIDNEKGTYEVTL